MNLKIRIKGREPEGSGNLLVVSGAKEALRASMAWLYNELNS